MTYHSVYRCFLCGHLRRGSCSGHNYRRDPFLECSVQLVSVLAFKLHHFGVATYQTVKQVEHLEHRQISTSVLLRHLVQRPRRIVDRVLGIVECKHFLLGQVNPTSTELNLVPCYIDIIGVLAWTCTPGIRLSELGLVVRRGEVFDSIESRCCRGQCQSAFVDITNVSSRLPLRSGKRARRDLQGVESFETQLESERAQPERRLAASANRVKAFVAASAMVVGDHEATFRSEMPLNIDVEVGIVPPVVSDWGKLSYAGALNHISFYASTTDAED